MKTNKLHKLLLLTISIGICYSFTSKGINIKSYYFPFEKFTSSQVYVYKNNQNSDLQYWKMWYSKKQKLLNTQVFDNDYVLVENTYENCNERGAKFKQFELYYKEKKYKAEILEPDVFHWGENLRDTLVWSVRHNYRNEEITTTRKRVLFKLETTYNYKGKVSDAIIFKDDYNTTIKREEKITKSNFTQYTTYAKKIGIVSYERFYEDGGNIKHILSKIRKD